MARLFLQIKGQKGCHEKNCHYGQCNVFSCILFCLPEYIALLLKWAFFFWTALQKTFRGRPMDKHPIKSLLINVPISYGEGRYCVIGTYSWSSRDVLRVSISDKDQTHSVLHVQKMSYKTTSKKHFFFFLVCSSWYSFRRCQPVWKTGQRNCW